MALCLTRVLVLLVVVASALGCASTQQRPPLTPSMELPAHAMTYPDQVSAAISQMQADETDARNNLARFAGYPGELKRTDHTLVAAVIELADREGQSQAYVAAVDRARHVTRFLAEHERQLGSRISGSVKRATEDMGCKEDVAPLSLSAARRALTKEVSESVQEHNAAQQAISEYEGPIGRNNVRPLRAQVDAVSMTSFIANVGMDDHRRELLRLAADEEGAAATLSGLADDLQAVIDDRAQPAQTRRLAAERLAKVQTSQRRLAEVAPQLAEANGDAETRVAALRKDYATQLDALVTAWRTPPKPRPDAGAAKKR